MKRINCIAKLSDIDYSPFAQNMDTDFVHAWADYLHWFPIAWFESALNRTELEACGTTSFIGEVPKIIKARSHEIQRTEKEKLLAVRWSEWFEQRIETTSKVVSILIGWAFHGEFSASCHKLVLHFAKQSFWLADLKVASECCATGLPRRCIFPT